MHRPSDDCRFAPPDVKKLGPVLMSVWTTTVVSPDPVPGKRQKAYSHVIPSAISKVQSRSSVIAGGHRENRHMHASLCRCACLFRTQPRKMAMWTVQARIMFSGKETVPQLEIFMKSSSTLPDPQDHAGEGCRGAYGSPFTTLRVGSDVPCHCCGGSPLGLTFRTILDPASSPRVARNSAWILPRGHETMMCLIGCLSPARLHRFRVGGPSKDA